MAQPHIELKRNKMRKFSESLISSHGVIFLSFFFYTETNPRYFFSALDVQATGSSHQLLCCLQAAYLLAFSPCYHLDQSERYKNINLLWGVLERWPEEKHEA